MRYADANGYQARPLNFAEIVNRLTGHQYTTIRLMLDVEFPDQGTAKRNSPLLVELGDPYIVEMPLRIDIGEARLNVD